MCAPDPDHLLGRGVFHWYGHLIGDGSNRTNLFVGYLVGAGAMIIGGIAAIIFGVNAEGKSLEDVARPLSVVGKKSGSEAGSGTAQSAVDPHCEVTSDDPRYPAQATATTATEPTGEAGDVPQVPDPRAGTYDDPVRARPDDRRPTA